MVNTELVVERGKQGLVKKVLLVISLVFALYEIIYVMGLNFFLYTILRGLGLDLSFLLSAPDLQQSMAFLLGLLMLGAFMIYPASRRDLVKIPLYDYLLGVVALISMLYLVVVYPEVAKRGYVEATLVNIAVPLIAIGLLLEASRRALGPALPAITLVVMLAGLAYEGFNIRKFINHMFYAREGVFAIPLFVMVSYVFAFVFFGSVLEKVGVGEYITKFVLSLVGSRWGGPAKTAVIASALVGTVSGSSVANVLITGTFTIPLMKRAGYPPEVAGAIEPAASTGGQLMPPVMGAAAFVMAQFLGRPYRDIAIAAAIPAILYFTSLYVFVDKVTKRLGVKPLPRELLPSFRELVKGIYMLLPIPLVTYLLISGVEPQYSALGALGAAILSSWIYQRDIGAYSKITAIATTLFIGVASYFLGLSVGAAIFFTGVISVFVGLAVGYLTGAHKISSAVMESFDSSYRSAMTVFFASACAGLIQGVLTMTGWATAIGYRLVDLSGDNVFILMLVAMVISLVLGMGVPTTANYIITSTIVGTPMARALASVTGVDFEMAKLVSHMFVFYFGIMADLTPPVALASYAGSMLAKSNFWKTSLNATKYALAGYLVPYIFALNPVLLILPASEYTSFTTLLALAYSVLVSILTILLLSAGIVGWHRRPIGNAQRCLLIALALVTLMGNAYVTLAAAVTYAVLYVLNGRKVADKAL